MTLSELLSKAEYYSLITDEEYKELKKQIQPCDDCISRKALINELKLGYFNKDLQEGKNDPCVIDAMIDWAIRTSKRLPSVTPSNDAIKEAYIKGYDYGVKDWFKSNAESCEDCISREEALEMLGDVPENWTDTEKEIQEVNDYRWFKSILEELPSVTPQQRVGRWILEEVKDEDGRPYDIKYFCSECQAERPPIWDDYCGACGAKMEVEG